jgi:hypothetical protein
MKKQTSEVISGEGLVNYANRVLHLGLDVHYRQVTVAMQEDGGRIKSAGKMGHVEFLNCVRKKLAEGTPEARWSSGAGNGTADANGER